MTKNITQNTRNGVMNTSICLIGTKQEELVEYSLITKWTTGKKFSFVKDVGITFDFLLKEIIRKNMFSKWTKKEKEIQLMKRGRYVEYNLLYDRGTKFGLNSGGNPEAILMSMPPEAKWK